jgi:hypothetical protein
VPDVLLVLPPLRRRLPVLIRRTNNFLVAHCSGTVKFRERYANHISSEASTGTCAACASDRRRTPYRPLRASGNMFGRTVVPLVRACALLLWLDRAFSSRSVWNAQQDYRAEYVGPQDCGILSNHRTQVVAGDHCLFVAEDIYQPNHIANKLKLRVILDVRRSVGLTVAAHIRGHCVVTCNGQGGHDGTRTGYSFCVPQVNWNRTKTIFPIPHGQ